MCVCIWVCGGQRGHAIPCAVSCLVEVLGELNSVLCRIRNRSWLLSRLSSSCVELFFTIVHIYLPAETKPLRARSPRSMSTHCFLLWFCFWKSKEEQLWKGLKRINGEKWQIQPLVVSGKELQLLKRKEKPSMRIRLKAHIILGLSFSSFPKPPLWDPISCWWLSLGTHHSGLPLPSSLPQSKADLEHYLLLLTFKAIWVHRQGSGQLLLNPSIQALLRDPASWATVTNLSVWLATSWATVDHRCLQQKLKKPVIPPWNLWPRDTGHSAQKTSSLETSWEHVFGSVEATSL